MIVSDNLKDLPNLLSRSFFNIFTVPVYVYAYFFVEKSSFNLILSIISIVIIAMYLAVYHETYSKIDKNKLTMGDVLGKIQFTVLMLNFVLLIFTLIYGSMIFMNKKDIWSFAFTAILWVQLIFALTSMAIKNNKAKAFSRKATKFISKRSPKIKKLLDSR